MCYSNTPSISTSETMKNFKIILVLFVALFFISSCGGPKEEQIKREFLERRPKASIVSISKDKCASEGCVWVSVKFNISPEPTVYEDKMQYFLMDNICKDCWYNAAIDFEKRLP